MLKKKPTSVGILYKLLFNKFRAEKLIKDLQQGSMLLQLKRTLLKEISVEFIKKITNIGSNLMYFKERCDPNVFQ